MLNYLNEEEKEFFFKKLINNTYGIYSPFEIDETVDFPKKDELGGVILKFIGGGATYFKIQTEMPSEEEVKSIYEVGLFLKENFGTYVLIKVLCCPHIEIYDINVEIYPDMDMDFASMRKSYGDEALEILTRKLEKGMDFTEEEHFIRFLLPFMGRRDEEEFSLKYAQFQELAEKSSLEVPEAVELDGFNPYSRLANHPIINYM